MKLKPYISSVLQKQVKNSALRFRTPLELVLKKKRQICSLTPVFIAWWAQGDLNPRPTDYESASFPSCNVKTYCKYRQLSAKPHISALQNRTPLLAINLFINYKTIKSYENTYKRKGLFI